MNDLQGETESRGHAPEDERRPARRGRCGPGRQGHRHPVAGGGLSLLGVGGVRSYPPFTEEEPHGQRAGTGLSRGESASQDTA